jgi:hypothetical protein
MTEAIIKEVQDLQTLRADLSCAKKRVGELHQQVKRMEDVIYSKCDHQWMVDYSNVGEHTEHLCAKCNLSKK